MEEAGLDDLREELAILVDLHHVVAACGRSKDVLPVIHCAAILLSQPGPRYRSNPGFVSAKRRQEIPRSPALKVLLAKLFGQPAQQLL